MHAACSACRARARRSRECLEPASWTSTRFPQELHSPCRIPRWLARTRDRVHRGPLCFPTRSSYTALMELTLALIFGLVIGSFLNVCIFRLPEEISITTPRSRCPQCKKLIPWYDNVPLLSYVLLGARCRHCKKKISARYPFIEALNGLISVLLYLKYGLTVEWFIYLAFSDALLVLAFIDLDHRILPDPITLNGIWLGILASVYLAQPSPLIARILQLAGVETTN